MWAPISVPLGLNKQGQWLSNERCWATCRTLRDLQKVIARLDSQQFTIEEMKRRLGQQPWLQVCRTCDDSELLERAWLVAIPLLAVVALKLGWI
jgi:hypothetical protein